MGLDFLKGKKHFKAFLVTIQTDDETFKKIIDKKSFSVGRALDCTLALPEPNISRIHILVTVKGDDAYISDQSSANGTFVNDEKIKSKEEIKIGPKDVIKLGTSSTKLQIEIYEKIYNPDFLAEMTKESERVALRDIIDGANQQAHRIMQLAQEHNEKLHKSMEEKALKIEKESEEKAKKIAEEIIRTAESEAEQIVSEGKKDALKMIEKGKEHAEKEVKQIYLTAEKKKIDSEFEIQKQKEKFQKDGSDIVKKNIEIGQKIILEAKEKALKEAEKLKEEYIENEKIEFEKKRKDIGLDLSNLKNEIIRIKQEKEYELKNKKMELDILLEKHNHALRTESDKKEHEIKEMIEEGEYVIAKQKEELNHLKELVEIEVQKKKEQLKHIQEKHILEVEADTTKKEREMIERTEKTLRETKSQIRKQEEEIEKNKSAIEKQEEEKKMSIEAALEKKKSLDLIIKEYIEIEQTYAKLKEKMKEAESNYKELKAKAESLERTAAQMTLKSEEEKRKVEALNSDYKIKLENKNKELEAEFEKLKKEKNKQFQNSFRVEEEKSKKAKEMLVAEINSKQKELAQGIHHQILSIMGAHVSKEKLNEISPLYLSKIENYFKDHLAGLTTQTQNDSINFSDIEKKEKTKRYKQIGIGLVCGIALASSVFFIEKKMKDRSMEVILNEQRVEREEELAQRKFEPKQDQEVRDNYTESVIYTKDFSNLYNDQEVQARWVKEASAYFYEKWRLPEEVTIEVLSKAKTIVANLEEKKQNIHPDFVDQNIKKMHELEDEVVKDMKDKLGTNVKYSAFKKLEKKFFMNELAKRMPAEVLIDPNTDTEIKPQKE